MEANDKDSNAEHVLVKYDGLNARQENSLGETPIRDSAAIPASLQADGRVTHIQVVKGLCGGLDEQAIEAVSKTVFLPGIVEGRLDSKATALVAEFSLR